MKFKRKEVYKACSPEKTIDRIRGILSDAGIFINENSVYHKKSKTAACSVYFGDASFYHSKMSTNGKGMDPRYSLASAYGEMMERLQAGIFFRFERMKLFSEGKVSYAYAPDETTVKFRELSPEAQDSLKMLLELTDEKYGILYEAVKDLDVICVPYTDFINGGTVLLPIDLYYILFTSSGLCAGNTQNEALSQGLSEIFERAALSEIYYRNPVLPLLPPEWFSGNEVYDKLEHLKEQGISYKILDASMGRDYPVIGLVLEQDGSIMMDLGADPDPVVALERCLTELFQVIREDLISKRWSKQSCGLYSDWRFNIQKRWYHSQFYRARVGGYGDRPDNLFDIPENYSESYTCSNGETEDFVYMSSLVRKLGYHMYVRDHSYLGFPAYQIVVPEISLGDFDFDDKTNMLYAYLSGKAEPPLASAEIQDALVPILHYIEKKQEEFYK